MRITVVYNKRPEDLGRNDPDLEKHIEGDEWKTIQSIGDAIAANNHTVSYLPVDNELYDNLKLNKNNIDLIFNLSEGIGGVADREAHLPMLAELLGIPHTGPGPLTAALILNKYRAKQIWMASGVKTAKSFLVTTNSDLLSLPTNLDYPLLVKPNSDGSGIGIHETSIVKNLIDLKKAINHILTIYSQPALVESYLPGREFTVAIVGNPPDLTILPIIEINFAGLPSGAPAIDSYEAKFVYGATGMVPMHETEFCPAPLTKKLKKEIEDLAVRAYTAIGCLDFGRLDIRLDDKGHAHVLEINHPPGLMSDPNESSFFTISARAHGWDFPTLIGNILNSAITRLKL
jgi:D-alanine-D-alanine ligase